MCRAIFYVYLLIPHWIGESVGFLAMGSFSHDTEVGFIVIHPKYYNHLKKRCSPKPFGKTKNGLLLLHWLKAKLFKKRDT